MNSHHHQQFEQNTQVGSGLTRYRSAPSSYFASLLSTPGGGGDGGFGADDFEQLFNPRVSSPETQVIFSRFMNSSAADPPPITPPPPPPRKLEPEEYHQPPPQRQSNDYSPQIMYSEAAASATDTKVFAPFNTNCAAQNKIERGGAALIRHTSSPAGFFANINIENDFKTMRSEGSFGGGNNATAEVATFSSANTFLTQMDYSSSSRGIINTISENDQFDEDHANDVDFITGLPWDDSSLISDPYLRRLQHNQKNEAENQPASLLTHHLSLPKSSAAMERLLEDSVPCKIRAKRGCATHPRSIAERVRRTKISQRMRKLQELVPNMEKQTNTSDMLDLAVDYIKDLQTQLKTLSDNRAKCTCSSKQ